MSVSKSSTECNNETLHGSKRAADSIADQKSSKKTKVEDVDYDEFFDDFFNLVPAYMWSANYWIALSEYMCFIQCMCAYYGVSCVMALVL